MPLAMKIDSRTMIKQYPYRTAVVHGEIMKISRDSLRDLEQELAEAAGTTTDNHTVYSITSPDGQSMYIMFSDMFATFGLSMKERRW